MQFLLTGENIAIVDQWTATIETIAVSEQCHPRILIHRSLLTADNSAFLIRYATALKQNTELVWIHNFREKRTNTKLHSGQLSGGSSSIGNSVDVGRPIIPCNQSTNGFLSGRWAPIGSSAAITRLPLLGIVKLNGGNSSCFGLSTEKKSKTIFDWFLSTILTHSTEN